MPRRAGPRLFFETIRYLKPVQIWSRVRFRLVRIAPDLSQPPALRRISGIWVTPARRRQSQFGPGLFRFLSQDGDLGQGGWDNPAAPKLWRYNLHYFDDLNAVGTETRSDWHRALIARWIAENLPGRGTGWEPYPTSLRIVNWIKWRLAGHSLPDDARHSLAIQTRWLSRRVEYHLLGNHLFANAKALVFAGCFFEGAEAQSWLEAGLRILLPEIEEQILPDGGHFELSPMYHALALEDLLDLANLMRAYAGAFPSAGEKLSVAIEERVPRMLRWLSTMRHPDGEISFFNDAAFGIAPTPAELAAYANKLDLKEVGSGLSALTSLPESGYVRLATGPAVAILDAARIGPDYQPGHGHADTLSFELSLAGGRVLVNSGTSLYGSEPERLRQRGTAAHNTVVVAGEDSSEVWSGFRVARRAKPFHLEVANDDELRVACSHDGYPRLSGRPVHRRVWLMSEKRFHVCDTVTGGEWPAEARFHFHPDFTIALDPAGGGGVAHGLGRGNVLFAVRSARARIEPATWHPEFGTSYPSQCLVVPLEAGRSEVTFRWDTDTPAGARWDENMERGQSCIFSF